MLTRPIHVEEPEHRRLDSVVRRVPVARALRQPFADPVWGPRLDRRALADGLRPVGRSIHRACGRKNASGADPATVAQHRLSPGHVDVVRFVDGGAEAVVAGHGRQMEDHLGTLSAATDLSNVLTPLPDRPALAAQARSKVPADESGGPRHDRGGHKL